MKYNIYKKQLKHFYRCLQFGIFVVACFYISYESALADQRNPELANLFLELKTAKSLEDGEVISSKIWQIWTTHESDHTLSKQMQMGIDLMQSGQLRAAKAVFSYIIEQDNKFAEAWNKRATVLFFMGDFEKSKIDIAQTLALESNHFGALAGLGMVEVHLGNPKAALEAYKSAASINPHLLDVKKAIIRLEEELKGVLT